MTASAPNITQHRHSHPQGCVSAPLTREGCHTAVQPTRLLSFVSGGNDIILVLAPSTLPPAAAAHSPSGNRARVPDALPTAVAPSTDGRCSDEWKDRGGWVDGRLKRKEGTSWDSIYAGEWKRLEHRWC